MKQQHLTPVLYGLLFDRKGSESSRAVKILLDSGTSGTILAKKFAKKLKLKKIPNPTVWNTKGGNFVTEHKAKLRLCFPELDQSKVVTWDCYVDSSDDEPRYDVIIGRDLLKQLKFSLNFDTDEIECKSGPFEGTSAPMKDIDDVLNFNGFEIANEIYEGAHVREASERVSRIQAAHYEKADLTKLCKECSHLAPDQQEQLFRLLKKYEFLFDGTLGTWNTSPVNFELKPGATPYYGRPYPVPRVHEAVFRAEVKRLCEIGVLSRMNDSEWGAPTFIQPKKNGTVRFLSDFRELNKRIVRKPFPIPKIQDMLLKIEGFQYATSLDLNMGYYHIRLSPEAKKMCTIVLPWGKFCYNKLPMGVCNSPDIFQSKMAELFQGFEHVRAYIDDLLLLTKSTWANHLDELEAVLQKLAEAGLKVNAEKSFFGQSECEYLGFWVTRTGIRPIAKKVEAIKNLKPPKTQKQVRSFVGLVNYYRDMWPGRAKTLAPLTKLTSKNVKFKWGPEEQKAFDDMIKLVSREVLLAYPNFDKPFVIHTDASKTQLGGVISQDGKPIAFYSRKLSDTQTRYTTTERELLSIVETLKEFRTILLGQKITVYTDHKNLTFKEFNTDRVIRWRLLVEEYGPEIIYIKGPDNIVADAISRLHISECNFAEKDISMSDMAESYDVEKLDNDTFPLTYKQIKHYQKTDKALLKKLEKGQYSENTFRGGGKSLTLISKDDRIVIPKILQTYTLNWYHTYLLHPGSTRLEETIKQHLYWPNLQDDCKSHVRYCDTCQRCKKQKVKYGHLPAKTAEVVPWERLCVDLIGPYKIERKGQEDLELKAVTMIDPATGWFEIAQYDDKKSMTVANIVEQVWLSRYPRPDICTVDRGGEFIGQGFKNELMKKEYGIKVKMATTANPQANSIIERVHQVIGNMIRTFELEKNYLDEEDPWTGILAATAFAVRSTFHTTLKATPGQLVFGRDLIFNIKHIANWKAIQEQKQKLIHLNNRRENSKRIQHKYSVGDKVLFRNKRARKYETPYGGPFKVTETFTNGTIRLQMGAIEDVVNIRHVTPFKERTQA